jgi:excisionase family DNA binding protein
MAATYTVKQVANILGYSTNSIYTFLKEKRIKGIRVGSGRFRIPKSELDRLLLISKQLTSPSFDSTAMVTANAQFTPAVGISDVTGGAIIEHTKLFGFMHVGTLNIFDWFIGIGAIVLGLGLFLFNASTSITIVGRWSEVVETLRILLIGCGIGIILTNIMGDTHTVWHKLFHVVLGIAGIAIAVFFASQGDMDGMFTYGLLALLVLLSMFIHIGGVAWVSIYMTLITITTPIGLLLANHSSHIASVYTWIPFSPELLLIVTIVCGLLFIFSLWRGYFRSKSLFWVTTWVAAIWYFVLAFSCAVDQFWSRSFFFLVFGMTSLFLSPWELLATVRNRKADLFTLGVFGAIFLILISGIGGVYLLQSNVISTVERENANKVDFVRNDLAQSLESVESTIGSMADNQDFITAVTKKDLEVINENERIMYEGSHAIRRLVLLDAQGHGINLYPFGTFDKTDYSFRDYFTKPRDSGTSYISDIFTAEADQSTRQVVVISVPLFDAHHVFIGVLGASLDLMGLSAHLQQIAVPERGEVVITVDSRGRQIISSTDTRIGTKVPADDPTLLGIQGRQGVLVVNAAVDGKPAIVAYAPVAEDSVHWGIAIKTPLVQTYQLTDRTNLTLFSVIIASVILAGCILQGGFFRWRRRTGGGSP